MAFGTTCWFCNRAGNTTASFCPTTVSCPASLLCPSSSLDLPEHFVEWKLEEKQTRLGEAGKVGCAVDSDITCLGLPLCLLSPFRGIGPTASQRSPVHKPACATQFCWDAGHETFFHEENSKGNSRHRGVVRIMEDV